MELQKERKIATLLFKELMNHKFTEVLVCGNIDGSFRSPLTNWSEYFWAREHGYEFFRGATKICFTHPLLKGWVVKTSIKWVNAEFYDWAAREAELYELACQNFVDGFFAATYYVGECGGHSFVIQELAAPDEEALSATVCGDVGFCSLDQFDDEDTAEQVYAVFGDYIGVDALMEFVEDNSINDLHSGNYGFDKAGRVKVIDFCGYHCW